MEVHLSAKAALKGRTIMLVGNALVLHVHARKLFMQTFK